MFDYKTENANTYVWLHKNQKNPRCKFYKWMWNPQISVNPWRFCISSTGTRRRPPSPKKETNQDRWKTGKVRVVRKKSDKSAVGKEKEPIRQAFGAKASSVVQKTGFLPCENAAMVLFRVFASQTMEQKQHKNTNITQLWKSFHPQKYANLWFRFTQSRKLQ